MKQIFTRKENAVDFRKNLRLETILDKLNLTSCLGASSSVSVTNIAKILPKKSQNQAKSAGGLDLNIGLSPRLLRNTHGVNRIFFKTNYLNSHSQ